MQCRPAVNTRRRGIEPDTEHEVGGVEAPMKDGMCEATVIITCQR